MIVIMREYRIAAVLADQYQHLCSGNHARWLISVGQTEKNSMRANVFRFDPESGPCPIRSALRICANTRLMHRSKNASLLDHLVGARE
jgi:hypothetical protein